MYTWRVRSTIRVFLLLSAVAALLLPSGAQAQDAAQNPAMSPVVPPANFRRLGLGDSDSHPVIYATAQDSFGFQWFATPEGLERFDGSEFRTFHPDAEIPACGRSIRRLFVDRYDRVWSAGTGRGACLYEPRTGAWHSYLVPAPSATTSATTPPISVRDFAQDAAGTVWMATSAGLAYLPPNADPAAEPTLISAVSTQFSGTPPPKDPFILYFDAKNILWIASYGGQLDSLDAAAQRFTHYPGKGAGPGLLSSPLPVDLAVDRTGSVWIATWDGGLNRFDTQTGELRVYRADPNDPAALSSNQVMAVLPDSAGRMWVGTYGGGLNLLDTAKGRFTPYRNDPADSRSLSNDNVVSLYEDRGGLLWVGTEGGGVSVLNLNAQPFQRIRRNAVNQFGPGLVTAVAEDASGKLWVGTSSGGLTLLDRATGVGQRFTADLSQPAPLASDSIGALTVDHSGQLWIGTPKGLARYNAPAGGAAGSFTPYRHDDANPASLRNDTVSALAADPDGSLWVGTYGGLSRLDPSTGKFTHYVHDDQNPNSLSRNDVRVLLPGSGGDLWIGVQNGGVNRLDKATGRINRYRNKPGDPGTLSSDAITALALDSQGYVWVGTDGDGLNRLDPANGSVKRYGTAAGLPNERIFAMLYAPDRTGGPGALWVATGRGLARLDLPTETFRTYDAADGIFDSGFTPAAASVGASGELFFGSPDGVLAFDPAKIVDAATPPQVQLTDLLIRNAPATLGNGGLLPAAIFATNAITLPSDLRSFSLAFAAPGQWNPATVRYRYRLQGYDRDWIEASAGQRIATYTNLNPGPFIFHVQAAGRDGTWNEPGRTLAVGLKPAWWETSVVRLLAGLAAVALVALAVISTSQAQLRRSQRRNQQLQAEVAERTTELSALLDISKSITSERDLEPLLRRILEDLQNTLPHGGSIVLLEERAGSILQAYQLAGNAFNVKETALRAGALAPLVQKVEAQQKFTLDPSKDASATALADLLPKGSAATVWTGAPVMARDTLLGLLLLCDAAPGRFDQGDYPTVQRFATQVAIAADNARLYARSQQLAVAVERNRLSRELHDTVSQYLHSIGLHADAAERALAQGKIEIGENNLHETQQLARAALTELRGLIADLRLTALQDNGLAFALQSHVNSVAKHNGFQITFDADYPQRLPADTEFELYRIAQEAITNAVKHSGATEVKVLLCSDGYGQDHAVTRLTVTDNGCGFDVAAARLGGTFGLSSIDERVQKIGGKLAVRSDSTTGTTVQVEVQQ